MRNTIIIDPNKCIRCGLCTKDCTNFVLAIAGDKVCQINDNCIMCGHCQAICPQNAITLVPPNSDYITNDIETYDPETFKIDADHFLKALKFRRSIRHFLPKQVEPELVRQLIEAGRFTPTGANRQTTSYIVLEHDKDKFQHDIMNTFRRIARFMSSLNPYLKLPIDFKKLSRAKDDFLFKQAPLVLLIVSQSNLDGGLASANIEQMANALGLGVLHVVFLTYLAKFNFKMRRELGLKFGQSIVDCLAIGWPAVHYQRTVARKQAQVTWR